MKPALTGWHKPFVIPNNIPVENRVEYCVDIVEKYRAETILLRKDVLQLKRYRAKVKLQDEELERLKRLVKQKDKLIAELEKTREELGKLIKDYKDQRDMYRGMVFKENKSKKSKDKKGNLSTKQQKRGRKKGHKGVGRKKPKADRYQRVYATHCPCCHKELSRTNSHTTHTVEDIPELLKLHTIVTEYEIERQWCGNCKKEVQAAAPMVLPNSRVGIHLIVTGLLLKYDAHMPINKVVRLFKNLFGIALSEGGFDNILKRAKKLLGTEYEKIRNQVQTSRVKHADETGWRIEGDNNWIWAFASSQSIYYRVEDTRGKGVAEEELKTCHENDILVRDDYSGYKNLPLKHQSCWAHLLRKSHEAASKEDASTEVKRLHKKLTKLYRKLSKTIKKPFDIKQRQQVHSKAWRKLKTIIRKNYTHEDARKIQTRITNQRKKLLTAALHKDVPLTNNHAERQIRHMVTMRKISGGSKTMLGARTHAVNMSMLQTIKLQNKPLVSTLQEFLIKGARGP